MRVMLFGATGMVGQGVLRECLRAPDVDLVQTVGRSATGQLDPRLNEIVLPDMLDHEAIEASLQGFDACFFCLGVSSAGMTEDNYARVTYDLTLTVARTLSRLNPQMVFIYVSGAGTDSTEQGRSMWARVKGKTENALKRLPFKAVYLFRPGVIQPLHGIQSKTRAYRILYTAARPLLTLMRMLMPNQIVTTECVGLAMLALARSPRGKEVLDSVDINAICRAEAAVDGSSPLKPHAR